MTLTIRIIFFFGLFATTLNAQLVFYSHWNKRQGLPSDIIYDLGKDSDDYLFLGTELGLYRFNGIRFQAIPFLDHRSVSVTSIILDNSKTLWCRNFSNQIFYLDADTMRFFDLPDKFITKSENILDIKPYKKGIIILTTNKLIYATRQFCQIIVELSLMEDFTVNSYDELYIINSDAFVYKFSKGKLHLLYSIPLNKYRLSNYNNKVIAVPKQNNSSTIWELKQDKPELFLTPPLQNTRFINTVSSHQNFLFLATNKGLEIFDQKKWQLVTKNIRVSDVIIDYQGNMWISSLDNGLFMIPDLQVKIIAENEDKKRLTCVALSQKGIYTGTKDGFIYELDSSGKILNTYDTHTGHEIEYIHYDAVKGHLYCSQGVFFNANPKNFKSFYFGKNIQFDTYGNVYFSLHNQAALYVIEENPHFSVTGLEYDSDGVAHYIFRRERSRCIYYDTIRQNVWIGYASGLILHQSNGKEIEIKEKQGKSLYCTSITSDSFGRIWVSTIQNGIFCFKDTNLIYHISQKDGLSGNMVRRLISSPGYIYAITSNGVDKIDIKNFIVSSMSKQLGLHQLGWIDGVYHQNSIYILTGNGIINIPDTLTKQEILPKIWISKTPSDFYSTPNHIFNYRQNNIEFTWNILSYRQGNEVIGYYRLLPIDSTFHPISLDAGSLSFSSLSYGDYKFEFKVPDANYSYAYLFSIQKPFWLTIWFIVAEFVLFLMVLVVVLRISKRRIRKKQILKEKLIYSQLTALRAQMNPHFIYNILNSIQGLVYAGQKEEAAENIGLFSDMMRKVLDISSKQYISLNNEIEMLQLYLEVEKLRMPDLEYTVEVDKSIDLFKTQIPSMIIQPYVENSIKHGLYHKKGEKKLLVSIQKKENKELIISITDNGIGRSKAAEINKKRKKYESFSTNAIDSRIQLFNDLGEASIKIEVIDLYDNNIPFGTKIKINILTVDELK